MRNFLAVIFLYNFMFVHSQRTEIVDQSGYKHDYVVTSAVMFENLADTTRGKYIATIKITDVHGDGIIGNSLNVLKMKAKELNANMYYVLSYTQDEKNTEVIVRVFFASEKMLKDNEQKQLKNTICVFNQFRGKEDTAWFYLNKEKITFNQQKFYQFNAVVRQPYTIEVSPAQRGGMKMQYSKAKKARFVVIPASKKKFVQVAPVGSVGLVSNGPGQGVNLFVFGFKKNQPIEIDYDLGRFLTEIYK